MNKLFILILSAILSLPISVWAVDEAEVVQEEQTPTVVNTLDEESQAVDGTTPFKEPISKRKIAKKFLAAMGGVAVSSFAIYVLLTAYNKVRDGYIQQVKTPDGETSLETPDDLDGAIRTFLDKTKWS